LRVFSAILCAVLGALGAACARRNRAALFPGACLALLWWLAVAGGDPGREHVFAWCAAAGALPAVFLFCRISTAGQEDTLRFPLDARLVWAVTAGFLLRGALVVEKIPW